MKPENQEHVYYQTRSLCPTCEKLVPAKVFSRDGAVYIGKTCQEHGHAEGLVCSDVAWFEDLDQFDVEPIRPKVAFASVKKGCPDDCGLCESHRQIAGTATIEISNKCNANCPICLADNKATFEITPAEVGKMIDDLLLVQDAVHTVTLSGGEPTIHPKLFEILDTLQRPEVERIAINSNGIRICNDDAFLDRLATYNNIYITLHFDGTQSKLIRGIEHEYQAKALDRLLAWKIPVAPTIVAVKDVNESELGSLVKDLLLRSVHIKTVLLSMMTYTGSGGSDFQGDPLERLTVTGALDALEKGSGGVIKKSDFVPVTMPNPVCTAIGYYLVDEGELTPLLPLGDMASVIEYTKNSNLGEITFELEYLFKHIIDNVYANPDKFDDPEKILHKFKRLLTTLFPEGRTISKAERRHLAEERIKSIYLFQLMDKWNFDTSRLNKCMCQHLFPGKKMIPSCAYYSYHRAQDPRFLNKI